MKVPKLRSVEKFKPPYPLNKFPSQFPLLLGKEIIYLLATRESARLEGEDWEEIFAGIIGAEWKPSNVGLDDVVLEQCAWGAKTVKTKTPSKAKQVRLISGRNSPTYSYGETDITKIRPSELGQQIVEIWNERVSAVKRQYKHLRTVVLIKSNDLLEVSVFEFETLRFDAQLYKWKWNRRKNLEGFDRSGSHKFTWQPHGSQFTIIEEVPATRLALQIRRPSILDKASVLKTLRFDPSWVKIL